MTDDIVIRNRARQIEWYGEPLGDRFRRLLDRIALPQSALAEALGLSAPMLSQLMSGHRAKISNPAVLTRLLSIEELVAEPDFPALSAQEVRARLAQVRESTTTPTAPRFSTTLASRSGRGADPVAGMQALLRGVASAAEIEEAAALIQSRYPDLAAVLRVYGNGRTRDARAHYARIVGDP